jgi:hypothetical protein
MRRPILAAIAAVSMLGASGSAAIAQSATPLSLASQVQSDAGTNDASDLRGGFILPVLAVLAIIGAIILLTDDNGPSSP